MRSDNIWCSSIFGKYVKKTEVSLKSDKDDEYCTVLQVQQRTAHYSTVQHSTAQYSTVLHSTAHTVQYCTVQHSTTQYCTVQHSTAQYCTVLHTKINITVRLYLCQFFLEWEIFQTKVVEKIKTHILRSVTFYWNLCCFKIMRKKYYWARQVTGDSAVLAQCMFEN